MDSKRSTSNDALKSGLEPALPWWFWPLALIVVLVFVWLIAGCASADKIVGLETELTALKSEVRDIGGGQGSTTGLIAFGGAGQAGLTGMGTILFYVLIWKRLRNKFIRKE